MAHNLMMAGNGQFGFAFNVKNGLPWHGLGQPVDGAMSWREAIKKAHLDWSCSKRQLFGMIRGEHSAVEAWGIFRDDTDAFLGVVGEQYQVIQNAEAFDFVDTLLEQSEGSHYDTAGALGNGERIFVSATVPYTIAPDRAPDDKTNCHLMFCTSHDGSLRATAKLTTVRVVCNNTLSAALSSDGFGEFKARHTAGGRDRMNRAKDMLSGVQQSVETLRIKLNTLAERKIDHVASNDIMNKIFGENWKDTPHKRNQVERIANLFDWNDGNAFPEIGGSAYAMLQSITNWVDHEKSVRETKSVSGMSEQAIRTQAAIFNGGDAMKTEALEIILQATAGSPAMPTTTVYRSAEIPKSAEKIDNILDMVAV